MKKIMLLLVITILAIGSMSCAYNRTIEIDGVMTEVPYYGIATEQTEKRDDVLYEPSFRNVFWGIVGVELIFPLVNVVGWNLMKPVKETTND